MTKWLLDVLDYKIHGGNKYITKMVTKENKQKKHAGKKGDQIKT